MNRLPLRNRIRAVLGGSTRRAVMKTRLQFIHAARTSCRTSQQQVLQSLLRLNAGTDFAADFGLKPGMTLAEFRRQVPIAGYELLQPYIERVKTGHHAALLGRTNRLLMLAMTSGTTAESKLIPVPQQFVQDYRRGWQTWGIGVYDQYPALNQLNIVQMTSSHRRFLAPDGTPCGNISGLVAAMQRRIVRSMYSVPYEVAEIGEADTKRWAVLRCATADPHVGMVVTANPSTVLQMAELMDQNSEQLIRDIHDGGMAGHQLPDSIRFLLRSGMRADPARAQHLQRCRTQFGCLRPQDVWPSLVALGVWCGGSAAAYVPRLREHFPGVAIRDHGLHASEGRMTLPLQDDSTAGVLEVQTHFFEFLPVEQTDSKTPDALEAHELQEGREYFILLTTSSGLCRYNIQDVVRCVGFFGETPLLEFRHKGSHISSITGEKIVESQVVEAVRIACVAVGTPLRLFTLTPEWSDLPGYVLYVDPSADSNPAMRPDTLTRLAEETDTALQKLNMEYEDKRSSGRLSAVRCQEVKRAAWNQFTRTRTSRSGGSPEQYKHPCLLPDARFENIFRIASGLIEGERSTGESTCVDKNLRR